MLTMRAGGRGILAEDNGHDGLFLTARHVENILSKNELTGGCANMEAD